MSISPPSDIVLDAVRAADPAKLEAGLRTLAAASAGGQSFETALTQSMPAQRSAPGLGALGERMRSVDPGAEGATPAKAYRGLEAFLLQTMIGAMLPQKAESMFGKGLAGSVFKSMLAGELGSGMARSGGIGIAKALESRAARQSGKQDLKPWTE